jgi:hypothetical protein
MKIFDIDNFVNNLHGMLRRMCHSQQLTSESLPGKMVYTLQQFAITVQTFYSTDSMTVISATEWSSTNSGCRQ